MVDVKTWNEAMNEAIRAVAAHFPKEAEGLCVTALNYELSNICAELTSLKKNFADTK